jgi:DNA modification methylase
MTQGEVRKPEEEKISKLPSEEIRLEWSGMRKDVEKMPSLPFQTIETINESKADREANRLSRMLGKELPEWRNRLIWGENKCVMSSLLHDFAGKIDLIYIDPPFATGADFYYSIDVEGEGLIKEPSMIEELVYRDTWGRGLASYLQMMYDRLYLMKELLAENGSIYVHLDAHVGHYIKVLMDEIFGIDSFQREIIWRMGWISGFKTQAKNWIRNHDTILFYVKDKSNFTFNKIWIPYPPDYERWGGRPKGKGLAVEDIWGVHVGEGVNSLAVVSYAKENLGFPTQKPESLLERIITVSSNKGDLVADFFCGSGTALVVAEKFGRRWIGCDLSRFAIHLTRKRLLQIPNCHPFDIINLGKYERQYWQRTMVSGKTIEQRLDEYYAFILKLYKAEQMTGFQNIHGRKGSRLVHVGAVDAPVTLSEIEDTISECIKLKQDKLDILGWEFEMGMFDVEIEKWAQAKQIDLQLKRIPREVMDKRLIELQDETPVTFFDLGVLNIDPDPRKGPAKIKAGEPLKIQVTYFNIPHLDLIEEEEVRKRIKKWEHLIDYWSIDWDYKEDTFHNQWQDFRTRKEPEIRLKASSNESEPRPYQQSGIYKALVKVIDIFGNDTTRMLEVHVR